VTTYTFKETSASIFRAQDKMGTEVSSKHVLKFHCLLLIGTKVTKIRTHFEYKITSKTQKAGQFTSSKIQNTGVMKHKCKELHLIETELD
jgi:hypothetical protein